MNILRAPAWPALVLAAHFAFCASARAEDARTAFQFPAELAGFSRGDIVDFESRQPGLGIGFPYGGPGIKAHVYVYDFQVANLPEGIGSSAVLNQAKQAEADVFKTWSAVEVLSAPGRGSRHCDNFLRMKFSFGDPRRDPGDRFHSYLYLGSRKGNFVKFRITYPVDAGVSDSEAAQERFTQALCRLVGE